MTNIFVVACWSIIKGMQQERSKRHELDSSLVKDYAEVFINRWDMYPLQLPGGTYASVKKPLSLDLVTAHLLGKVTLGAYALDGESHAKWVCFDADGQVAWQQLRNVAASLTEHAQPVFLEPSRRGGHLWLFTPKITGLTARRFAKQLLAEHDIAIKEIFPKQDRLHSGPGSFVRLPLGVHLKTGRRYHFVDLEGEPIAPTIREQMAILAAPPLLSPEFIEDKAARYQKPQQKPRANPGLSKQSTPDSSLPLSEQIKRAVSVIDFVSQYVELDRSNRGHCPFHDDEHKSFQVDPKRNFWHCYAGCKGQTVIDFEMRWRERHGQSAAWNDVLRDLATRLL